MSIALKHKQKLLAQKQAGAALSSGTMAVSSQYELMLGQLATHKRQLKQIQSVERKVAVKADFLPEYDAYIDGVLAAASGLQDDVLTTIMVWRIDIGDISGALQIAEYALQFDIKLPEIFDRDLPTLLVEEIAENAMQDDSIDVRDLYKALELTKEHDMPDEVRAKLHKAIGLAEQSSNIDEAINQLERSMELNPRSGVKKLIDKLKKQQTTEPTEEPEG